MSPVAICGRCKVTEPRDIMVELRNWALTRDTATGPRVVLDDIDFVLHRGDWLAILGANGSGKSSLLRYLATADSVVRGRSALLCQDPDEQLVTASVAEELSLGHGDLDVEYWLSVFGLSPLAQLDPRLLSAGQKQRLQLAVVEVARPEIMLCDEPTSLQDPAQAAWVIDRLELWRHQREGTIVTATQDRREMTAADLVLVLQDNKQVLFGSAAELGIEVLDLRFKRIRYREDVESKVFDRMIAERKRMAEQFRSEGAGEAARINGERERELQVIRSEAYRKQQEIKGRADAEAANIYAKAYNGDPEFYRFVRSMEVLGETLGKDTTLLLATDGELMRYLEKAK